MIDRIHVGDLLRHEEISSPLDEMEEPIWGIAFLPSLWNEHSPTNYNGFYHNKIVDLL